MTADILIVGGGPAGVSAALYAKRAGFDTALLFQRGGALFRAERIENYYGLARPLTGRELFETGLAQAEALGVRLLEQEVTAVEYYGRLFHAVTKAGRYEAQALVFATGAGRLAPPVPGLAEHEGHGVSYCAVCDAFFYRGKDVAVLGAGEYALHEALVLQPAVRSVTLLTNGQAAPPTLPEGIALRTEPLAAIEGEQGRVARIRFREGEPLALSGVFVAYGVAGSSQLARSLGAQLDGDRIAVDELQRASIDGLFACGDCTGGLLQVAKAVHDGAVAGMQAAQFVRNHRPH